MPPKLMVTPETGYEDTGLEEFSFMYEGREYKVTPKPGKKDKLDEFLRYVKFTAAKKDINPFTFRGWKNDFNINRVGTSSESRKPAGPEQMRLKLARKMDLIALDLQERGLGRYARMLKPLAMGYRRGWLGPQSIGFFDDVSGLGIQSDDAVSIVDSYEGGVPDEIVAKETDVEPDMCHKVIGLAKKHGLVS